jgi:hypothetical protein
MACRVPEVFRARDRRGRRAGRVDLLLKKEDGRMELRSPMTGRDLKRRRLSPKERDWACTT